MWRREPFWKQQTLYYQEGFATCHLPIAKLVAESQSN